MDDIPPLRLKIRLPPKSLQPNSRPHWAARARDARRYRETARLLTLHLLRRRKPPRWESATAQATFFFRVVRRRDGDNLLASLKPAFDGIVDAGVLVDDSGLTHLPVRQKLDRAVPRVEITITKGNENDDG